MGTKAGDVATWPFTLPQSIISISIPCDFVCIDQGINADAILIEHCLINKRYTRTKCCQEWYTEHCINLKNSDNGSETSFNERKLYQHHTISFWNKLIHNFNLTKKKHVSTNFLLLFARTYLLHKIEKISWSKYFFY